MTRAQQIEQALTVREFARLSEEHWAYFADETQRWYVVDEDALVSLAKSVEKHGHNGYSLWCQELGVDSQEMPEDWSPEDWSPEDES